MGKARDREIKWVGEREREEHKKSITKHFFTLHAILCRLLLETQDFSLNCIFFSILFSKQIFHHIYFSLYPHCKYFSVYKYFVFNSLLNAYFFD